jgi:hypothetical protein
VGRSGLLADEIHRALRAVADPAKAPQMQRYMKSGRTWPTGVLHPQAIGWGLREYAWHDSKWVRAYVDELGDRLSPLSRREALRNIT